VVVSGVVGSYIVTLTGDAGIGMDLTIEPGQDVHISGDSGLGQIRNCHVGHLGLPLENWGELLGRSIRVCQNGSLLGSRRFVVWSRPWSWCLYVVHALCGSQQGRNVRAFSCVSHEFCPSLCQLCATIHAAGKRPLKEEDWYVC
jgi:hypothetical protein